MTRGYLNLMYMESQKELSLIRFKITNIKLNRFLFFHSKRGYAYRFGFKAVLNTQYFVSKIYT